MLNLSDYFKLQLPIKDGEWWDGRPREYSNLKQWRLAFTQQFGGNPAGIDYTQFGLKGHNGIDIAGLEGTPIVAPCKMWITFTKDDDPGYGYEVRGETESITVNGDTYKLELTFGHFSKITCKPYKWVEVGSELGKMGTTGFSTGNHLHFQIRAYRQINNSNWQIMNYDNGYKGAIDPEPFMPHIVWDLEELLKPVEEKTNFKNMLQKVKRDCDNGGFYFIKKLDDGKLYKQKFDDNLAPVFGALAEEFGIENWHTDKLNKIENYKFFGK